MAIDSIHIKSHKILRMLINRNAKDVLLSQSETLLAIAKADGFVFRLDDDILQYEHESENILYSDLPDVFKKHRVKLEPTQITETAREPEVANAVFYFVGETPSKDEVIALYKLFSNQEAQGLLMPLSQWLYEDSVSEYIEYDVFKSVFKNDSLLAETPICAMGHLEDKSQKSKYNVIYYPIVPLKKSSLCKQKCNFIMWFRLSKVVEEQDVLNRLTKSERSKVILATSQLTQGILLSFKGQLKKIRSEIKQQKRQQEVQDAMRSEFLSRVSHELRTPLNAILGFTQVLEMRMALDDVQQRSIKRIKDAGKHMLNLVDDVLDIVKADKHALHLTIESLSVWEIVLECMEMLKPIAAHQFVTIECPVDETYTPCVYADRQRFKQIFINLLSNAIKYNREAGSVLVSFAPYDSSEENFYEELLEGHPEPTPNMLQIKLKDTGVGIEQEKIDRLFSPFDRLDFERLSEVEGTGLGLALSQNLVKAMGGEIFAYNNYEGQGATFCFTLPLVEDVTMQIIEKPIPFVNSLNSTADIYHNNISLPNFGLQDSRLHVKAHTKKSSPKFGNRHKLLLLYVSPDKNDIKHVRAQLPRFRNLQLLSETKSEKAIVMALRYQPDVVVVAPKLDDMLAEEFIAKLKAHKTMLQVVMVALQESRVSLDAKGDDISSSLTNPLELSDLFANLPKLT